MLQDILAEKKSLFSDGVQTVLRGHENRRRSVSVVNGNLVNNVRVKSRGINARVSKNGINGFASIGEYDSLSADKVLKEATDNAFFLLKNTNYDEQKTLNYSGSYIKPHFEIVDNIQKRYIDLCMSIDSYIGKTFKNLHSRTVVYSEDSQDKIIYTSNANNGHVINPRCYLYVYLTVKNKEGIPLELFEVFGGSGNFDNYFTNLDYIYTKINSLYNHLMEKKEGVYAKAGYKDVILSGRMAGMLAHEAVGHTVEADLVLGGSVALKNLNKVVASPLISLTDFANTSFGEKTPIPIYMDDEGILAEDNVLIKDGILIGYMNNMETSMKFNMKPKGNARAWDFGDEPLIRMRNTAIHPGKNKLEDMISSIDDGYYLISSGNGQADLTGEFMFGVTMGYEIKNGKLGKAILDTTVSGVAFDMLKTVDMVSDRLEWESSGFCGKKQIIPVGLGGPDIKCKIMIGGR